MVCLQTLNLLAVFTTGTLQGFFFHRFTLGLFQSNNSLLICCLQHQSCRLKMPAASADLTHACFPLALFFLQTASWRYMSSLTILPDEKHQTIDLKLCAEYFMLDSRHECAGAVLVLLKRKTD